MLLPAAIVHAVQARECEREANAEERKIEIVREWEARTGAGVGGQERERELAEHSAYHNCVYDKL